MSIIRLVVYLFCINYLPIITIAQFHRSCRDYYWLHPPKTGSTFCLTLQHVCCKEIFEEVTAHFTEDHLLENEILKPHEKHFQTEMIYGCAAINNKKLKFSTASCPLKSTHHRPLPQVFDFSTQKALTILREPKSRLISAFLDSYHHEGMTETEFEDLKKRMFPTPIEIDPDNFFAELDTVKKFIYAANVYANESAFIGCQSKMIMGYQCGDTTFILLREPLDQKFIEDVRKRVRSFFFVGLFEEYDRTVKLFHVIGNTTTVPNVVEYLKLRTSDNRKTKLLKKQLKHYHDPYDSILYEEAKKNFLSLYNKHFDSNETRVTL